MSAAGRPPRLPGGEATPRRDHTSAAVDIYTDGACKGNPGPGGWGALLVSGTRRRELSGGERATTNNRMELTAVIRALEALRRPSDVELYTDSQYVKNGIESWIHTWKRNGWKTAERKPVKNAALWRELDALAALHRVRWHWIKGHNGHPANERADALANEGVEQAMAEDAAEIAARTAR
jgi:ribonuclease HI